ncbi:MAG TPA: hypothetical protein VL147_13225 [Devosia sp.]|nr:hypothetical protein [Devosia sp.]
MLESPVLQKVINKRIEERHLRTGKHDSGEFFVEQNLKEICAATKSKVMGQYLAHGVQFKRIKDPSVDQSTLNQLVLEEFESRWSTLQGMLELCPGKEVFSELNARLQSSCGINITPTSVLSMMTAGDVPSEIKDLIRGLDHFRCSRD